MIFNDLTSAYAAHALNVLHARGSSPRGQRTREVLFQNYTISDALKGQTIDWSALGMPERQRTYDDYRDRELKWYRSGDLRASSAPSKFWLKLADTEGNIVSNYGHMVLHDKKYLRFGRASIWYTTALDRVIEVLSEDPESRQAIIHYNLPMHCYSAAKDVPCTLTAQVWIRNGMLSMWVTQRSCDIWYGLPYDVPWHCWLICELAEHMAYTPGMLHHSIGSLHVYEKDVPKFEGLMKHFERQNQLSMNAGKVPYVPPTTTIQSD